MNDSASPGFFGPRFFGLESSKRSGPRCLLSSLMANFSSCWVTSQNSSRRRDLTAFPELSPVAATHRFKVFFSSWLAHGICHVPRCPFLWLSRKICGWILSSNLSKPMCQGSCRRLKSLLHFLRKCLPPSADDQNRPPERLRFGCGISFNSDLTLARAISSHWSQALSSSLRSYAPAG